MLNKLQISLLICIAFFSTTYASSLHHILYYEKDIIEGYQFSNFIDRDSSVINAELSKSFGGFDLDVINGNIYYQSTLWGLSLNYTQSGQEDLEMYGDIPTIDPIGKFGVYSKLFSLAGNYTFKEYLTLFSAAKLRTYSVIDSYESQFFGSLYVGSQNRISKVDYRAFAGVWNYTPHQKSVAHLFLECGYNAMFYPTISSSIKYYSQQEEYEVYLKLSGKALDLIELFVASEVSGNNIFSTGLNVEYKRYGVSYELNVFQETVQPIHKIAIKIPIL